MNINTHSKHYISELHTRYGYVPGASLISKLASSVLNEIRWHRITKMIDTDNHYEYGHFLCFRQAHDYLANQKGQRLSLTTQMLIDRSGWFPLIPFSSERWQSGWMHRSWKPARWRHLPGFESLSLRHLPSSQRTLTYRKPRLSLCFLNSGITITFHCKSP